MVCYLQCRLDREVCAVILNPFTQSRNYLSY
nr:MAG TPA: hypothetical protein [Caudoviricetes sp.]